MGVRNNLVAATGLMTGLSVYLLVIAASPAQTVGVSGLRVKKALRDYAWWVGQVWVDQANYSLKLQQQGYPPVAPMMMLPPGSAFGAGVP